MATMTFKVDNDAEKETLKNFAKAKGLNLSSWVRSLMFMDIATTEQGQLDKIEQIMKRNKEV